MNQIKNCSRCYSKSLTENDFGKDKHGEYFSTCNQCREYSNQRKANNREAIQQYNREHYQAIKETKIEQCLKWRNDNIERITALIECECGKSFQHRWKHKHEQSAKHKKYIDSLN